MRFLKRIENLQNNNQSFSRSAPEMCLKYGLYISISIYITIIMCIFSRTSSSDPATIDQSCYFTWCITKYIFVWDKLCQISATFKLSLRSWFFVSFFCFRDYFDYLKAHVQRRISTLSGLPMTPFNTTALRNVACWSMKLFTNVEPTTRRIQLVLFN